MELIILVIGILIGLFIERYIFQEKPIGSLRVDQSDPDSGPYLFLELDPGGAKEIHMVLCQDLVQVKIRNFSLF